MADEPPQDPGGAAPAAPRAGAGTVLGAAHSDVDARRRYALLLVAIVAVFAVTGTVVPTPAVQVVVSLLLGATLLLALATVRARRSVLIWARAAVLGVITLSVIESLQGNVNGRATQLAFALLVGLAPPAIVLGVVRTLRARQAVTFEAVFGVLCVYLLLGLFFAFVYSALNRVDGGSFFASGQAATTPHCVYFSFITLTTVGYGDFTARTNLGHTLSAAEALLGQIYLVTVVSLIVANLGRARPAARAAER